MTGLQDVTIRTDLKPYQWDPKVKDEELVEKLTVAYTLEMEKKLSCPTRDK